MRSTLNSRRPVLVLAVVMVAVGAMVVGCQHDPAVALAGKPMTPNYTQVNLVSDLDTFMPKPITIDPNMVNAWGLATDMAGNISIAANGPGLGLFYDDQGNATLPLVNVPAADGTFPGVPSGQVFNSSNEFWIPGTNEKSKFIYSTEDGIIAAWASGPNATIVVSPLDTHDVYKGLAMAMHGGKAYLYATNFGEHRIDVFDGKWKLVQSFPFIDTGIPADYSPFGIANLDDKLWVSYAIPKPPEFHDDTAGAGHGIIDIYTPNGSFVRRFYSHGVLNSPWGITRAPEGNGPMKKMYLIANFGDGMINTFDNSGAFLGSLKMPGGDAIVIDGLWGIMSVPGRGGNRIFFTAGPNSESDGLFGYLQAQ